MRFSLEKDFKVKVDHSVIASSHACDMSHCLLANGTLDLVAKNMKPGTFKVSAVPNGVIVSVTELGGEMQYEYVFDRLTLAKINNFDGAYEHAIANGADELEAQAAAREATRPFEARAKFFGKQYRRRPTPAQIARQEKRRLELIEGRSKGIIPPPTPRPARTRRTGRRVLRMGFKTAA